MRHEDADTPACDIHLGHESKVTTSGTGPDWDQILHPVSARTPIVQEYLRVLSVCHDLVHTLWTCHRAEKSAAHPPLNRKGDKRPV